MRAASCKAAGRISIEGAAVVIGEGYAALYAYDRLVATKERGSAAGDEECSSHGIGRPGHFGSGGLAAPPLHRRRSRGDGRGGGDGGGRARRTDRRGIGSDVAEGKPS